MRVFQTPGLGGRRLSGKARGQGCCPRMCENGGEAGDEKGRLETRHHGVWTPEKKLELDLAGEGGVIAGFGTEICRCVWGNLKWGRQRAEMAVLLSPRREAESRGIQGSTPEVHERRGMGPQCDGRMGLRAGGRLSPLYPRRGREEMGTPGQRP